MSTLSPSTSPPKSEAWKRWMPVWHAIFYGALLVSTLLALSDPALPDIQRAASLGLTGLFAGWYAFMIIRQTPWLRKPLPMMIYFLGALALAVALISVSSAYFLVAFSLFGQAFGFLPLGWAIAVAVMLSVSLVWQQARLSGQPLLSQPGVVLGYSFVLLMSGLFGFWINAIIRESRTRKELIERLEATQRDLAAAEHQAGILEERQRLAREIHDTLAQSLTSIVLHLEAAEQALPHEMSAARHHMDMARRTARSGLDEARRVVADLRPDILERDSLPNALQSAAQHWSDETHILVQVNVSGELLQLGPSLEVTLLRVAQEALANVSKHAHASRVILTLSYMGDAVTLDVQDNGVGFEADRNAPHADGGFGLITMRERMEQLGGHLLIESAAGEGTTVVAQIPLQKETAHA